MDDRAPFTRIASAGQEASQCAREGTTGDIHAGKLRAAPRGSALNCVQLAKRINNNDIPFCFFEIAECDIGSVIA